MKKRKEKKSDLPLKRVISNDWFALRLLWQACPGKVIYVSATNLSGAVMPVVSLFFLRFAVNSAQNGDSFQSVVKWLLLLCAVNVFQGIRDIFASRLQARYILLPYKTGFILNFPFEKRFQAVK